MPATISDFFIFLGWLWTNIVEIFKALFVPLQYIYSFFQSFFSTAFSSPVEPETIWSFNDETLAVFGAIPYFHILIAAAIAGISLLFIIFILKTFLKS